MQPRRSPLHDAWRERVVLAYIDEPPFAQPGGPAGARLGVVSGQVQHDTALRAGVPPGRVREFETQRAALAALRAGEIHAYASTALGNRAFVGGLGDPALQAVELEGEASTAPVGAFSFALADTELRGRFDAFLVRHLGSPAHRESMAAHGLSASEIDPVLPHRL